MDLIGTTLGDFRIVRRLGSGAMGVVYEAIELSLGRSVALKVLPEHVTRDPQRRARLLREARAAAAVSHAAVATVYQVGEVDDRLYIAMELVAGTTLREHASQGPLPVAEALRIAHDVARGLGHAHEHGIVHRDIKPDNVMISPDGGVKILDFGVARFEGGGAVELTHEGDLVGSPGYMSPEQSRSAPIDARSDVFSLGVLVYELLTDTRPFTGTTPMEVLIAAARDPHVPLAERRPDLPPAVIEVVERCLAKDPDARYPDGRAVADALAVAMPVTITAPGPTRAGAPRRLVPGALLLGAGGSAALALVLATGGGPAPSELLREPGGSLACPVFEVVGPDLRAPSGWLGAAAAHQTCERAAIVLGGALERSRVPAELLELPRQPVDDFPADPYGADDARARTLAAAGRHGAWLDGTITHGPEGFALELRLGAGPSPEDARREGAVAIGRGKGRSLPQAVRGAMDALVAAGELPMAEALDASIVAGNFTDSLPVSLAAFDFEMAFPTGVGVQETVAEAERWREQEPVAWAGMRLQVHRVLGGPRPDDPIPPDDATVGRRRTRILVRALAAPSTEHTALADELAAMRRETDEPMSRALLINGEGTLRYFAGDAAASRALFLSVLPSQPRLADWSMISMHAALLPGSAAVTRAATAWRPDDPNTWNASSAGSRDPAERLRLNERAAILGPGIPLWNLAYAFLLTSTGQRVALRSLGARLALGTPDEALSSEVIAAMADGAEGAFGKAFERARSLLMGRERLGRTADVDGFVVTIGMGIGTVIGRARELGDDAARRFVLAEPHRLVGGAAAPKMIADICVWASPEVAAACFARLRELQAAGFFSEGHQPTTDVYALAAEAFARGDHAKVVELWRPQIANVHLYTPTFAAMAFDAVGESEIASRLDVNALQAGGLLNGATSGHVREARRACKAKDWARCRQMARQVVDAWGVADVKLPQVDEMKALLAAIPVADAGASGGAP